MSNTVSSSSGYSISGNAYKGMAGLASGVDTESMVEQMLSGTQSKIDKVNQESQQITWKQEMYRDVINKIAAFQSKFFSLTTGSSNLNMMTSSFFNSMSAVSSSSAVKVTANSSAASGKNEIRVAQMATNSSIKSAGRVSGNLEGTIDPAAFKATLDLKVSGTKVSVDISAALDAKETDIRDGTITEEQVIVDAINSASSAAGSSLTASLDDKGKLKLEAGGGSIQVLGSSSNLGLSMTGLYANKMSNDDGEILSTMVPDSKMTVDFSLNGVTKTITLDDKSFQPVDNNDPTSKLNIQASLDRAFGTNQIKVNLSGNKISFQANDAGQQITVNGSKAGLDALGMVAGQSDKIGLGLKLEDIAFNEKLQGSEYKFKINDVEFTFTGEDTVSSVISKINSSEAGVKITYNDVNDTFSMESASTGEGFDIKIEQDSGNLLSAMFGAGELSGNTVASHQLVTKSVPQNTSLTGAPSSMKSGTFKINVDGQDFSITLKEYEDIQYTSSSAITSINAKLAQKYGYTNDGDANIEIEADGSVTVRNGSSVSFGPAQKDSSGAILETDVNAMLGLVDTNNIATSSTNLSDVVGFDPTATGTVQDLLTSLNGTSPTPNNSPTYALDGNGRVTVSASGATSITIPAGSDLEKIFGSGTIELNQGNTTPGGPNSAERKSGQNAIVNINGVSTERSSNTFTVNGLLVELQGVTGDYALDSNGNFQTNSNGTFVMNSGTDGVAAVDTTRDTEKVLEGLKTFVEDYNKLIDDLNKLVDEEATYKKYPPLTSAQKKEMSDREVELWEEKSKTGLLRNDSEISTLLANMRSVLYSKPEGSNISIFDLGIETSSDWRDKGKLVIKDEGKLKQMLESNAQDVEALFVSSDGILRQMNTQMNKAAKTSSGDPGSLVKLAGVVGKASENSNTLSERLYSLKDRLKDLNKKYEKERSRYWRQFTSMETAISNLNNQSSWLMQQFGG